MEYLSHIISAYKVEMDPKKASCVIQWPIPKLVKDLRGFLGLTGYYKRFVDVPFCPGYLFHFNFLGP